MPSAQTTPPAGGLLNTANPPDPQQYNQFIDAVAPAGTTPAAPTVTPQVTNPGLVQGVAAPTPNTARDLTPKETVAGQLNDLLNQNSTYMQNARSNANAVMNARGLLNSSLAVGAGQKAAIESALPIAQQDATANANSGQLAQQGNQDIKLTGYNAQLGSAQATENAQYRAGENAQNIQANKELQAQKAADDRTLRRQADASQYYLEMDRLAQTVGVDLAKLNQADRARLTESYGTLSQQLTEGISRINAIPTSQLSTASKQRMIDQLIYDNTQQSIALFTLNGFTYPSSWDNVQPPAAPTTPTTPGSSDMSWRAWSPLVATPDIINRAAEAGYAPSSDRSMWVPA